MTDPGSGRQVAVVTVEAGYAVHAVWHNKHFSYYIRAGRQSREASPEELFRLQQRRGGFRAELRPISGTSYEDLDQRRLTDYFQRVRGQTVPARDDRQGWVQLLSATEFLVEGLDGPVLPSYVSMLLAGKRGASELDIAAFLGMCRVTGTERERLLALCREQDTPGWFQQHGTRMPKQLVTLIDHENKAVPVY